MRYLTAEDRLDQEHARLEYDVVQAALKWRKAWIAFAVDGNAKHDAYGKATGSMVKAVDALLAFLEGDNAK